MFFQEVHYKNLIKWQKYYFINEFNEIIPNMTGEYIDKKNNQCIFKLIGSTKNFRRNPEPWVIEIIHYSLSTEIWIDAKQTKFYLKIILNLGQWKKTPMK